MPKHIVTYDWYINTRTDQWELTTIVNGVSVRVTQAPFNKIPVMILSHDLAKSYDLGHIPKENLANIQDEYIKNHVDTLMNKVSSSPYNQNYKEYLYNQVLCLNPGNVSEMK